jgi:DNA-binding LytR/AlgR family response regulator
MMNTLKMSSPAQIVPSPEMASDALGDVAQHSGATSVMASDPGEEMPSSTETFRGGQTRAKPQSLRAAIKVRGKILFINLGDVIAVQAKGRCVYLQRNASSYLLRESISVMAERLETRGFIRIHRSVLVNTLFVAEISPLTTGEYRLRVEGGREYTVSRTYKKNLQALAEFWIGTGAFFTG